MTAAPGQPVSDSCAAPGVVVPVTASFGCVLSCESVVRALCVLCSALQFTSKMEGMVTDLALAREKQQNFEEWKSQNERQLPIDISVTVLTTGGGCFGGGLTEVVPGGRRGGLTAVVCLTGGGQLPLDICHSAHNRYVGCHTCGAGGWGNGWFCGRRCFSVTVNIRGGGLGEAGTGVTRQGGVCVGSGLSIFSLGSLLSAGFRGSYQTSVSQCPTWESKNCEEGCENYIASLSLLFLFSCFACCSWNLRVGQWCHSMCRQCEACQHMLA